jgi:hypothetical protein
MLHLKILLALTASVALVLGVLAVVLSHSQEQELRAQATRELTTAAANLEHFERLNDFSLMEKAERIAAFPGLQEALTQDYRAALDPAAPPSPEQDPEYLRHLAVHDKGLLRWKFIFDKLGEAQQGRRAVESPLHERPPAFPEMIFVTDDKGVGVAALGTGKYDWFKTPVGPQRPVVQSVSDGATRKDVWLWSWAQNEGASPYHVGVAPVTLAGSPPRFAGAVVVGSLLSDGSAKAASEAIGGQHVGYFVHERLVASTLPQDEDLAQALAANPSPLDAKPNPDGSLPSFTATIQGQEYLVTPRLFTDNADAKAPRSGFLVFVNMNERVAPASKTRNTILGAALLLLLAQLGVAVVILQRFIKPLEDIDQGIQEVIAGNKDYVFQTPSKQVFHIEFVQALNLMSAYLQGKQMPDEEAPSENWGAFMVGEVTRTAVLRAVDANQAPPAPEDPAAYRARLYGEYVTALKNLGQATDDLTQDKFFARLDKQAEELRAKHNAKEVRFSVVLADGKIVLKPHPIF